uniref:RAD52 motif-containing protein 1 n=1 Tax=Astyanax mexicanus TaxID=7994 RepID=A0A8B9GMU4_ASTMX
MEIEVEVIEFRVPAENNKTIFIWDIQTGFSEAFIYEALWSVYSAFGALYLLKVCPNAAVATPGFYAMVKFYSSAHASKAQRATDKQCLFQSSPVKVKLSTKQNPNLFFGGQSLSHARCQNLANHYLGFNGWSTRIVTLKDISKCADAGWSLHTASQGELLKYGCVAELTFPQYGVTCRGVGVAEDVVDPEKGESGQCAKSCWKMKSSFLLKLSDAEGSMKCCKIVWENKTALTDSGSTPADDMSLQTTSNHQ